MKFYKETSLNNWSITTMKNERGFLYTVGKKGVDRQLANGVTITEFKWDAPRILGEQKRIRATKKAIEESHNNFIETYKDRLI